MKHPSSPRIALLPLLLALSAAVAACDAPSTEGPATTRAAVELVETLRDDGVVYQVVEVEGERRIVVDGETEGRRIVAVAEPSGAVLALAVIDANGTRRLDADRVLAGELEALAEDEADTVSELVLEHFAANPDAFRGGLTAAPRTQAMPACLQCLWHILFGNPDLMHPACGEC